MEGSTIKIQNGRTKINCVHTLLKKNYVKLNKVKLRFLLKCHLLMSVNVSYKNLTLLVSVDLSHPLHGQMLSKQKSRPHKTIDSKEDINKRVY